MRIFDHFNFAPTPAGLRKLAALLESKPEYSLRLISTDHNKGIAAMLEKDDGKEHP